MRRMLLLAGLVLAPCLAPADTIIVTSAADAGPGTLRQAVLDSGFDDFIVFSPALRGSTITLLSEISINDRLTIRGLGPELLTISGGGTNRLFTIGTSGIVTLQSLRLTGGHANLGLLGGGAIFSEGRLRVENCVIENNSAFGDGGAIYATGIFLSVRHSLIKQNTAGKDSRSGGSGGGVFILGASARIEFSTLNDNRSRGGNAPQCGGGVYAEWSLFDPHNFELQSSTVSANQSGNRGAGVCLATPNSNSTVEVTNSTISGNSATIEGGGFYVFPLSVLQMVYTTVANNEAATGGGMFLNASSARLERSIFADNTAQTGPDIEGMPAFSFSNLLTSSVSWADPTDQVVSDAGLGPLADNGGPTLTHALTSGSPAIDFVASSDPEARYDQRGFGNRFGPQRCDTQSLILVEFCDAGAFEAVAVQGEEPASIAGAAFLQGIYVDAAQPFNATSHAVNGRLPVNQPFSGPPWNYNGTEIWSGDPNVAEWVLVELRETPYGPPVQRRAAFVGRDGLILDANLDEISVQVPVGYRPYHLVYRFRNHLDQISPFPVASVTEDLGFGDVIVRYSWKSIFTGLSYNLGATVDAGNRFAARAGDMDADDQITGLDVLNVWRTQFGISGNYIAGDLDFDGDVDVFDLLLLWLPNNGW